MREAPLSLGYSRLSPAYQHFYPQDLCTLSDDLLINPFPPPNCSENHLMKNHSNRHTLHI